VAARRANPVAVLVVVALVVAAGLAATWRWADGRARDGAEAVTPSEPAGPDPSLATPALSTRRAPGVLARALNLDAFRDSLQPLAGAVGPSSCLAVSVDDRPVLEVNPSVPVIPGSNVKLVVAAVALEVLGEDHRFATSVRGDVDAAGVVGGDLHLVGGGDPLLSTEAWRANTQFPMTGGTPLEQLADDVVAAGVTRVDGAVVGDGTRYDDEWFVPSWTPSDGVNEAGPYDALLVDDARTGLLSMADDPAVGAAQVLTELLEARGVAVAGEPASGRAGDAPELAVLESDPLPAVLAQMLTFSDNNTAELLLKEIGLVGRGRGSREAGAATVEAVLEDWELPTEGVEIVDGSGLSIDNRITCEVLLGVLRHGSADDAVGRGLPVAAESGTLAGEFVGTPVAGRLRAKTGRLVNAEPAPDGSDPPGARALSGYLPVEGGGAIEVVLVLNGQTVTDAAEYRPVWDELLAPALASYPAVATIDDLAPR